MGFPTPEEERRLDTKPKEECLQVKLISFDSPSKTPADKVYLKFWCNGPDGNVRAIAWEDVAKNLQEKIKPDTEINLYGYWKEYRGDREFYVKFFALKGDKGNTTKKTWKQSCFGSETGFLQAKAAYKKQREKAGYFLGYYTGDNGRKIYNYYPTKELMPDRQLKIDYLCDILGPHELSRELRDLLDLTRPGLSIAALKRETFEERIEKLMDTAHELESL